MARIEEVQAKGAREGGLRGTHDRFGAKRQAALGLREQRSEEARDGGGPALARKAIPAPTLPTSHDRSMAFFSTLDDSGKLAYGILHRSTPE